MLFGLIMGYLVAIPLGKVDFSGFAWRSSSAAGVLPVTPEFNLGAIITVTLIFLVSATETVGDCSALTAAARCAATHGQGLSGAVDACDGLVSSLAGVFGCSPVTSFSQNVGLIAMTGVVNRRAIATGAVVLVLAGFVPVVSLVFASFPRPCSAAAPS